MPAPAITGEAILDGIVAGQWAGGSSLVLTYSVPTGSSTWTNYGAGEEPLSAFYQVFNTTQRNAFYAAMELYDSLVAATFNQTSDATSPGNIRIAFTEMTGDAADAWGYAYLPSSTPNAAFRPEYDGDIWVSYEFGATDFAVGGYDYNAMLHEIGHTLGLGHTFEGAPPIPLEFDNTRYSIMSYTDVTDLYRALLTPTPSEPGPFRIDFVRVNAITPMIFDIYALQSMYAAETTTRSGTTTYTFDQGAANLQTIYDAGGVDTWDLTGHVRPSNVDLRAASFSDIDYFSHAAQIEAGVALYGEFYRDFLTEHIDTFDIFEWTDNVAIAYGTTIENVLLGEDDDTAIGNDAANIIKGNGGVDNLQGGNGADTLDGGAGNDTLNGGAGGDALNGRAGADTMIGGADNDTYYVDNAGDVTSESGNAGIDTIVSTISRSLSNNIENLTLSGTANINASGNGLDNTLTGNSGKNTLSGGAGADTMLGGAGDDLYVVDNVGDVVSEGPGGGTDTIRTSVARSLSANVENLVLLGSDNLNASGNAFNNVLTGNSGNNVINGALGQDLLTGGAGADTFAFTTTYGVANRDRITDFDVADDTIRLENGVYTALATGVLAAGALNFGAAATDADDRLIYNSATGMLLYDADGTGAGGAQQVAYLPTGLALTNADFFVI